jgi:hypothetical protein
MDPKEKAEREQAERAAAAKRAADREAALNTRVAAAAASSRRMPSDEPQEATHLVRVSSFDRKGYDGFSRAGQMWPSGEGRLAYVTPRMLAALKAEPMLKVDEHPDTTDVDLEAVRKQTGFDVPVRELVDENALAIDEVARIQKRIDAASAKRKADDRLAVLSAIERGDAVPQWLIEDKVPPQGESYDAAMAKVRAGAKAPAATEPKAEKPSK